MNLFFGSLVAGSLFGELNALIAHPTSIITLLGMSVPGTGIFFMNYLMLQAVAFPVQVRPAVHVDALHSVPADAAARHAAARAHQARALLHHAARLPRP